MFLPYPTTIILDDPEAKRADRFGSKKACSVCGRLFATRSGLDDHVLTKHQEKGGDA